MRLSNVERGHSLKYRLMLGAVGVAAGRAPDVLRVLTHRPDYFGRAYGRLLQRSIRGPSYWDRGRARALRRLHLLR